MNNKGAVIIILALTGILTLFVHGQSSFQDDGEIIKKAIAGGNVDKLSAYFDSSVELIMPSNDGTFSKTQATLILKDFFQKNIPKHYQHTQKGNTESGSIYFIGKLSTIGNDYRIYYYLKTKENKKFYIQQFQIELIEI